MRIAAIFTLAVILCSCDQNAVFEENYEIDRKIWYVDSIPQFHFEIPETQKDYDILINIRNTRSYPFQNIYITYFLEDTTGNLIESDLVNLQLFEPRSGEPLGQGGLGDVYDHRFTILDNYRFSSEGNYILRLEQYMRRDSLPEIIAVGVRVDENNEGN